jgi:hypothetical protein
VTDKAPHYVNLKKTFPDHHMICHDMYASELKKGKVRKNKDKLYVRHVWKDDRLLMVTTNSIEARWKYIKADYYCTHVSYTKAHTLGYLAEAAMRCKATACKDVFHARFDELLRIACSQALPYSVLKKFAFVYIDNPEDPDKPIRRRVLRIIALRTLSLVVISVQKCRDCLKLL